MLGEAYRQLNDIKAITLPLLIITSEFGTVSMWDWEIGSYLRSEGVETIAPYNLDQTRKICRGLAVKRELKQTKFMVFQDNPGEGAQASIFKRFYWWEDECTQRMLNKFGITIVKKSFKKMGAEAQQIPDQEAEAVWEQWQSRLNIGNISRRALNSALKIYIMLKRELAEDEHIQGMGINCLNESHFSDTTPCLAWNMLYEERGLIWGCEGDTVSMLTKYILHKSLGVPIMMTNLYPFLMGQAALKHEKISNFPNIPEPENHILVAHCGYLGVLPQSFATEWTLRSKVLGIVDENATAIDARLPIGDITMAKLRPNFEKLSVVEGSLTDYAQYPGSDCLNGAVLKVPDGRKLMNALSSHHYLLMTGHNLADITMLSRVFDLEVEEI
jgi:L-fucose isomerase-like protein